MNVSATLRLAQELGKLVHDRLGELQQQPKKNNVSYEGPQP